ncbi:MAG: hypothetical protein R3B84_11215 [Zavarzinella sp.]
MRLISLFSVFLAASFLVGQEKKDPPKSTSPKPPTELLKTRLLGPAVTSGRVVGFAIHPTTPSTYYVAVASGGVWKTTNAGTTWTPIFDQQGSFSIGYVTLDPKNPNVVWVGTGENNSQQRWLRRWRVQIGRCGQDLAEHGSEEIRTYWQNYGRPTQLRYSLRGSSRPTMVIWWGSWLVQNHGRWQILVGNINN